MAKWTVNQIVELANTLLDENDHSPSPEMVEAYKRGQEAANKVIDAYWNGTLNTCPHCGGEKNWGYCSTCSRFV